MCEQCKKPCMLLECASNVKKSEWYCEGCNKSYWVHDQDEKRKAS